MSKLKILIADDHAVLRDGLKALVNSQPDMEVVGEAHNGRIASEKALQLRPDVMIMDVSMPELNGIQATEIVKRECPQTNVLALTAYKDKAYVDQLLGAGASGYMLKLAASDELIRAIRTVAAGEVYLGREIAERITESYVRSQMHRAGAQPKELTDREEEVLRLIAQGYSNKEIATQLSISVKTVESHKANLMEKLEITSRTEIVRYAVQRGWLQDINPER